MADSTTTQVVAVSERQVAIQMKTGNITEQYRPSPSYCPDESGSQRFARRYMPYAALRRRHTNGTLTANESAMTPFSVSYTPIRSPARNAYGCTISARARRNGATSGEPPG